MSKLLPTLVRWSRAALALAFLPFLAGCNFKDIWRMDGHQSTIVVEGPVAKAQLHVFYVTCWVSLVIFVIVAAVLAYAMLKFRAKNVADEHAPVPEQGHGNPLIELGLIGASILALVVIAVPTLKALWYSYDVPVDPTTGKRVEAYEVTATGYQWWFRFEYPGEQASVDANTKTPLITANELVIPAGRPVRINLRTVDVIHSFWVPKLAGKVDMIPNRANHLWLEAEKPGYYWGQCAEYCGDSHAVMRFRVIALAPREFAQWLDDQLKPARKVEASTIASPAAVQPQFTAIKKYKRNESGVTAAYDTNPLAAWTTKQDPEKNENPALIAKGRQLFGAKTCGQCHTVRGDGFGGVSGPDLTHVGSRTTIAGGLLENNKEQLQRWISNPGDVKAGNKMWVDGYKKNNIKLTAEEEHALVAYLESLK